MFKKTILIVTTLLLMGCNAQKKTTMEKFDIERFIENKNHLNEFKFIEKDSIVIEQMELKDIYVEDIIFKDSYFIEKSQYYKNGFLKITGLYFDSSFRQGVWKEFDEEGNLIKETDHNNGFDYTWEDLLSFLEKRNADPNGRYTTIRKIDGNWRLSYVEGIYIYDIIIEGKTGKIIQDAKNKFQEGS